MGGTGKRKRYPRTGVLSHDVFQHGQLCIKLGLACRGHTFYALRHSFETIGGESRDQVAVDAIMGHSRDDMASVYRERIGDNRLRAVAEHVRQWLWGKATGTARKSKE